MKAVVCRSFGPPPALDVEEIERPGLGAGEVRIAVHACGVNFPDALIIEGRYQFRPDPPFVPGSEVAGFVLEAGANVDHVRPGDRVVALLTHGGFAEELVTDAARVVPVPDGMDLSTAAGFLFTYGTAYHALVQRANLTAGQSLLVLGAAGGVGLAAVELGHALGARVIAVASTAQKRALAQAHGASVALDYEPAPLKTRLMPLTSGLGVDVVFDPVGGAVAEQALRSIAWEGRYLVIGFASGEMPSMPLNLPLLKGCSIVGVFWGEAMRRDPEVHAQNFRALFELYAAGKLSPAITEVPGLEHACEAIADLRERRAVGKLVVRVAD
jgi:NADPH2:quinone reductase